MYQPTDITFTDPREFDGNPYEVAQRAVAQAAGVLRIYEQALDAAFLMARNAHMERNLALGLPAAGDGYLDTAEGRKFRDLSDLLDASDKHLHVLARAVSYDPKHPAKA